jgi:hypothetical protein
MADSFAARFKAGKHMVTGLDKIISKFGIRVYHKDTSIYTTIFEYAKFIGTLIVTVASLVVNPLAGLCIAALAIFNTILAATGQKDALTYAESATRYKMIRNEIIMQLKSSNAPLSEQKRLINDIASIYEIIERVVNHRALLTKIANYFFSSGANRLKAMDDQTLMEELANNDLFLAAATLRTA